MRLLFVSPVAADAPPGGRALLANLHRTALREILGANFAEHLIDLSQRASPAQALAGHIDGVTAASIAAVVARIGAEQIDAVWLDGSNLGRLVQGIARAAPHARTIVFCHNVEARFFAGALRAAPGLHALGVLAANILAERAALRAASTVVTLSPRDSDVLARLYGRGADTILPMAMADQIAGAAGDDTPLPSDAPLLFAGGGFYANRAGIAWFAREVAPRIALRTQIVGRGLEPLAPLLAKVPNVELVGEVGDLAPFYRAARAVIAPIFDGSGMKTKVAEALMHGKSVIGTPEAFSGYAADVRAAGRVCADTAGFVAAIAAIAAAPVKTLDPALRGLYQRDHSAAAVRARLDDILRKPS